jgi:hypothetical protein
MYLVIQGDPKRSILDNITAALACYRARFGRPPARVVVHPDQLTTHPAVVVVAASGEAIVRRDTFWMPAS